MFALADSNPSAPSSPSPWQRPLRPLFARAAGLMMVAAVAGAAIAAGGAGELAAATYELVLDYHGTPLTRGTFEVPDARVGPANANGFIRFSEFTRFDVTINESRFDLQDGVGDIIYDPGDGLLLDASGQPWLFRNIGYSSAYITDDDRTAPVGAQNYLGFIDGSYPTWIMYDYFPGAGQGQWGGTYQIRKPVAPSNIVIITHGLAPGGDLDHPGYLHHITEAIQARLKSEKLDPTDTYIIEYEWPEAVVSPHVLHPATVLAGLIEYTAAFKATELVGNRLALKIRTYIDNAAKIQPGYMPNIHFIGHSLGSMVNAFAVRQLYKIRRSTIIKQFTILDDPLGVGYDDPTLRDFCLPGKDRPFYAENKKFFYNVLNTANVKYVENFYATDSCPKTLVVRFGGPLPGAGPIDTIARRAVYQGVRIQKTNHNSIHRIFYANLIRSGVEIPGSPAPRFLKWKSPVLRGWKPDIGWAPATARNIVPAIP